MVGRRIHPEMGMRGIPCYMHHPGMGGIPCYMHHPGMWEGGIPCYTLPIPPRVHPAHTRTYCTLHATARWCTLPGDRAPGSNLEKDVGRRRREPPSLPSCYVWCATLRRILPLFGRLMLKDWIDEGCIPVYYPMFRQCCAEGVLSPAIRSLRFMRDEVSFRHPIVRVNVSNVGIRRLYPRVLSGVDSC